MMSSMSPHHLLSLPDGRQLAVDERGDPSGRPVLWFHGAPSCRLEALLFDAWARDNGVRILAPDRPGMGQSSPHPSATVGDWSADVGFLLDHFGLERVVVMGGSGGGPYALAAAHGLAQRVDAAVLLASGGVDAERRSASGWVDRTAGFLARHAPLLLSGYFALMRRLASVPARWICGLATVLPGPEAEVLREPGVAALAAPVLGEAFRQGYGGGVDDYARLGRPWGFRLAEVSAPVLVVQGSRDDFVPVRQARHFAQGLPHAVLEVVSGAGHVGVIRDWARVFSLLERNDP